jgi:GH15 family glucan-1,4-alpha-glucosidase
MSYPPIEDHGIIGNLETCALINREGCIDWCCFPHGESSSIFASILDDERGGCFSIRPVEYLDSEQRYIQHTNVLQTIFRTSPGQVIVTDFMPVLTQTTTDQPSHRTIYRKVSCEKGPVEVEASFKPRFEYARSTPDIEMSQRGIVASRDTEKAFLRSTVEVKSQEVEATTTFTVNANDPEWFVLSYNHESIGETPAAYQEVLEETTDYWQDWAHQCTNRSTCIFKTKWHDMAVRSGLVLKLLIHQDTGAICAAPTTSLPEEIGGIRNWDYRFNWIRDAAFTVQGLHRLGHTEEAKEFFQWCLVQCHRTNPADIQPLYGLHGETDLDEETLDHLSGYKNSSPVRVGNEAQDQLQLDIYGELILGICETSQYGGEITEKEWTVIHDIINYVCEIWDEPDMGIWEVRGDPQHFTYSKVMCWAALDRGIGIVERSEFDGPVEKWRSHRQRIRAAVLEEGFNDSINSFTRSFENKNTLDATSLLFPIVGFLPFDDYRIQGTIDATIDRLMTEDGLVDRYEGDDGLPGDEGAFLLCSFWLVDALALSDRRGEAEEIFDSVLEYRNHLGLLAEEVDPDTGMQLGNFPQAFSHIGLINSALYLGQVDVGERPESKSLGRL